MNGGRMTLISMLIFLLATILPFAILMSNSHFTPIVSAASLIALVWFSSHSSIGAVGLLAVFFVVYGMLHMLVHIYSKYCLGLKPAIFSGPVGKVATVTKSIHEQSGEVCVGGRHMMASADTDAVIAPGSKVRIIASQGFHVLVKSLTGGK